MLQALHRDMLMPEISEITQTKNPGKYSIHTRYGVLAVCRIIADSGVPEAGRPNVSSVQA
eukprot:scaffold508424_cov38-Prasinocladus_malaysianus.AAC.1